METPERGVETTGILVKSLWYDQEQQRDPTFLIKFEPAASLEIVIVLIGVISPPF